VFLACACAFIVGAVVGVVVFATWLHWCFAGGK